jgi:Tol biopolymer transport system component
MFTLVWADRKGKEEPIADPKPGFYPSGNISPDGTKLVYMTLSGSSFPPKTDIWVWDFAGGTPTRLTFNESSSDPLWTPDGKRIVYLSGPPMGEAVYWKAADGRGQEEKLFSDKDITIQNPCSWSRDGKLLLLAVASTPGGSNQQAYIATLSMEGEHNLKPLIKEEKGRVSDPTVSPDGRWIAYTFGEPGKSEVYVRPFPEVDKGKWQISTNGGESPLWSRDGRELFYRNGDSAMAVFVQTVPTFKPIKAEILFQGKYTNWGIHPDGKRFLLIKRRPPTTPGSAPAAPNKINVVVNWIEELKQHFPAE